MTAQTNTPSSNELVLVLGATGKTGRRIVSSLGDLGVPVRLGSRSASPSFDWNNSATWDECIEGVSKIYINYAPDLAMPGATDSISELVRRARVAGVKHLVLLSGRGEEEAQACEAIIQASGIDWTIVRDNGNLQLGFAPGDFPASEAYYAEAISLPMYPELTEEQRADLRLIGALERLLLAPLRLPALLAGKLLGGMVFGLDHRIPNGTPLALYRYYVDKVWEILTRAQAETDRG